VDVLSDVLSVMRTGRPVSAVETWRAPWAVRFPAVPGAVGFRVVVRGSCVLVPSGAEPVRLGPGDVVLLPHGGGHVLADSPASTPNAVPCGPMPVGDGPVTVTLCGAYELAPTGTHPLLRDLPELVHLHTHVHTGLKAAVDLLTAELTRPGLGTDGVIPALLDTLLHYALRAWFDTNGGTGWAAALGDPTVTAALAAIHREPTHPWTVASLAAVGGLSRAPFAKRFTELTGQPPVRYLTWWRMTTAARLLRMSDAPLTSVAGEVGYHSEFAFATAFKRQYGIAPGRYRAQHHNGGG
jgi:AraC-like DNA-binding protein